MATKKKVIKKSEIAEIKPEVKEEKFIPLFNKPMKFTKIINKDINYYGIKQFLKNKFNLDFFRRLKENGDIKEEKKKDYKEELNKYWFLYSDWWNNLSFNKQVK